MDPKLLPAPDKTSRLSFWLLAAFLTILWLAGGASRADVSGQVVCRFFAWIFLAALAFQANRISWRPFAPLFGLLGLAVLASACQLVPLPPSLWTELPGHSLLARAAEVSGQAQPWRPISIAPGATTNALASLVVPAAVLLLCANLSQLQHWRLAVLLLGFVFAGSLLALLQVSGAEVRIPLINHAPASVSGNFANRNHFALFVASGCLLAAVIGAARHRVHRGFSIGALLLLPFFLLVVFGVGSRAGLLLTALAMGIALVVARKELRRRVDRLSKKVTIAVGLAAMSAIIAAIVASLYLGRATAVTRALELESSDDLRNRALPYVLDATQRYFPFGSGFGTFDPAYRIEEPYDLLDLTYFNHAHNDWLEVVMTGGAIGALILVLAVIWYVMSLRQLWKERGSSDLLPVAGAGILILFMIASLFDYPARTPSGMAMLVIAAVWLQRGAWAAPESAEERAGD